MPRTSRVLTIPRRRMTEDELELRAEAKRAVNKDMRTRNLLLYGGMAALVAIGCSRNIS